MVSRKDFTYAEATTGALPAAQLLHCAVCDRRKGRVSIACHAFWACRNTANTHIRLQTFALLIRAALQSVQHSFSAADSISMGSSDQPSRKLVSG